MLSAGEYLNPLKGLSSGMSADDKPRFRPAASEKPAPLRRPVPLSEGGATILSALDARGRTCAVRGVHIPRSKDDRPRRGVVGGLSDWRRTRPGSPTEGPWLRGHAADSVLFLDMAGFGFDALVCDMDGVIYRGTEPIAGSVDAVNRMRAAGVRFLFSTNNSRSTVAQYVTKLAGMGIDVLAEDILTSAVVTGEVLRERGFTDRSVLVVGGEGVRTAMKDAGLEILPDDRGREADVVVVGMDPDFTYARMKEATLALRAGASLIATNDDPSFPAPDGLWPGAGAVLASIETASGVEAEVMGKPNAPMMEAAALRLRGLTRIAVVGDRPETDLVGGVAMGWTTILVLSGVTARAGLDSVRPVPDVVVERLADLGQ